MKHLSLACFLGLSILAGCATAPGAKAPAVVDQGILVDAKRMTLYTFDADKTPGKSSCNGQCAVNWPPFMVAEGSPPADEFSVVVRDDGRKQWAYRGKPLYYWPEDQEPGDRYGDNYRNVWHVVKP